MVRDEEDYESLGGWSEQDVEQPGFEGKTDAGGGWSAGESEDRRAHPRISFDTRVELIPPDGTVHDCRAVNLSIGGVLLEKTNPGPLPEQGQNMVIEIPGDDIILEAVVVRLEPEARRFAAQFVNLDDELRQYLEKTVTATCVVSPSKGDQ